MKFALRTIVNSLPICVISVYVCEMVANKSTTVRCYHELWIWTPNRSTLGRMRRKCRKNTCCTTWISCEPHVVDSTVSASGCRWQAQKQQGHAIGQLDRCVIIKGYYCWDWKLKWARVLERNEREYTVNEPRTRQHICREFSDCWRLRGGKILCYFYQFMPL